MEPDTNTGAPAAPTTVPDGADTSATGGQQSADGKTAVSEGAPAGEPAKGEAAPAKADAAAPKDGEPGSDKNADGTPKAAAEKPVVPEAYTFDMPEGMELDEAAVAEFTPIAKELNLTQEQASKLGAVAVAMQQRAVERHLDTVAGWVKTVTTDKDLGGDKLPATLAATKKVMDTFGTPELKAALDASGYGNHPEFIRVFAKIGAHLSEDTFVKGGNTTPNAADAKAQRLYGASGMNP